MKKLQEYDSVTLKRDLIYFDTSLGKVVILSAGSTGTVLIVYSADFGFIQRDPVDYEVEFTDEDGQTLGLLAVKEDDIEFGWRNQIV